MYSIINTEEWGVMDMSEYFVPKNDKAWEDFVSSGSIYDYLKYKSKIGSEKSDNKKTTLTGNIGDFCEDRSKRTNN